MYIIVYNSFTEQLP